MLPPLHIAQRVARLSFSGNNMFQMSRASAVMPFAARRRTAANHVSFANIFLMAVGHVRIVHDTAVGKSLTGRDGLMHPDRMPVPCRAEAAAEALVLSIRWQEPEEDVATSIFLSVTVQPPILACGCTSCGARPQS